MFRGRYEPQFLRQLARTKDAGTRRRVRKLIRKILVRPAVGKPMRHTRKGTREVYLPPFRLAYVWRGDTVIFLDLYHKDEQ